MKQEVITLLEKGVTLIEKVVDILTKDELNDDTQLNKLKRDNEALKSTNRQLCEHIECLNKKSNLQNQTLANEELENKHYVTDEFKKVAEIVKEKALTKLFNKIWDEEVAKSKSQPIKSNIEHLYPKVEEKKEYEILSFIFNDGSICAKGYDTFIDFINYYEKGVEPIWWNKCNGNKAPKIHSVKRLSDNEVFSIGDKVSSTWGEEVITEFIIISEKHELAVGFETCRNPLSKIQKVKQPTKLFTTEDGKDIFKCDTFYVITMPYFGLQQALAPAFTKKPENYKRFSTKEKAEEYILLNKPILKLSEVMDVVYVGVSYAEIIRKLKELAKQKLNQ